LLKKSKTLRFLKILGVNFFNKTYGFEEAASQLGFSWGGCSIGIREICAEALANVLVFMFVVFAPEPGLAKAAALADATDLGPNRGVALSQHHGLDPKR
jgi:hypothetical protein